MRNRNSRSTITARGREAVTMPTDVTATASAPSSFTSKNILCFTSLMDKS